MKKVVLTGVESSGKTTLAQSIAGYFKAPRTVEFARLYLEGMKGYYEQDDLIEILQGQFDLEAKEIMNNPDLLVCDTGPIVIKVWSQFKFGSVSPIIEQAVQSYPADLFVIPHPQGVPFEADPLRENPKDRMVLFNLYLEALTQKGVPFLIVDGSFEDRLLKVKEGINSILS